jgi:tetratricopeptide (TPR) repeat protein
VRVKRDKGAEDRPAENSASSPEPARDEEPRSETDAAVDDDHVIDLLPDELTLARAQLDAGQPALAEGTLRARIAFREADGPVADDELDALRALLAESLWRQGRLVSARFALEAMRPSSPQRRLPIVTLIEAEALAAAGEPDRAIGALERVVTAIGVDEAHDLRAGVSGRLSWPLPAELRPQPAHPPRPPWGPPATEDQAEADPPEGDARTAAARGRLEEARVAYVAGDLARGDTEMSIAVRLDRALAGDGVAILEPTLGGQPTQERLLLYGDLLRAAGRRVEADQAYDRAADRRS